MILKYLLIKISLFVIGAFVVMVFIGGAYAEETKYDHVGIQFSNTCLSLIEIGDFETCGSPEIINRLFVLTSVKPSFQTLIDIAQGTDRTKYQVNNILLNHKYECITRDYCNIFNLPGGNPYQTIDQTVLYWVHPDDRYIANLDILINIHTNLKHANIFKTGSPIVENNQTDTRALNLEINNLYINPNCSKADYKPVNIEMDLAFVIWYMLENCKNPERLGSLGDPFTQELSKHDLDPTTSPNYMYFKELEELKEKYKENRLGKD